jgi:hypothetical protein
MLSAEMWRCVALVRTNVLKVTANVPNLLILFTLMMETNIHLKHQFLKETLKVASQSTAFFIVTAVKTSNFT